MCRIDAKLQTHGEEKRSPWLPLRRSGYFLLLAGAVCALGCRQEMADQPRQNPLSASSFFADGSARPLVEGTVPQGSMDEDSLNIPHDADQLPIPVTPELLSRGQERYNIFCSVCHGTLGDGDGMMVRRGYRQPPSYHTERLRQAPVGHFYDVILHGFGAMPEYATQIPRRDRLAIIAYIRALQLSQYADATKLPPEDLAKIHAQSTQAAPQPGGAQ